MKTGFWIWCSFPRLLSNFYNKIKWPISPQKLPLLLEPVCFNCKRSIRPSSIHNIRCNVMVGSLHSHNFAFLWESICILLQHHQGMTFTFVATIQKQKSHMWIAIMVLAEHHLALCYGHSVGYLCMHPFVFCLISFI